MTSYRLAPAPVSTISARKFNPISTQHGPLVSIVIPNFNHAQYLGDAIASVLAQTYTNVEIIVVDDGSTDHSRAVIAQFGSQIRSIGQENRGLSAARNTGIRATKGEYIGLLDADDLYEPNFLETLMTIVRVNPDIDGIYCGYQFVDQQNKRLSQVEARLFPTAQLHDVLLDGNFFVPESMLLHRRCYTQAGAFDEKLRACEDWDMWLRITSQYKIMGTATVLTRHRVLADSMSSDPTRMIHNRMAVLQKHLGLEPETYRAMNGRTCRAYGEAYLISAVEYLQYGDSKQAYTCLYKGVQIYPALLHQLRTFFELGCGNQPKGDRGNFATLELAYNAQVLMQMLAQLFQEPNLVADLRQTKREVYALAHFALGLLNYGAGQWVMARRYLLQAVRYDSRLLTNKQWSTTLAKATLGKRLVKWLQRIQSPNYPAS